MTFEARDSDLPLPKTIAESVAHITREDQVSKPTNPKDAIGIRKAPLSTVPMNVVAECGVAMLEGASKYGRHNYRVLGVRASVYFDATMRHLISYWEGQDEDPDTCEHNEDGDPVRGTGLHHVTKAIVSLMVLRDAMLHGKCTDDRPPVTDEFYPVLNNISAKLLARHGDKKPHHYTIQDDV